MKGQQSICANLFSLENISGKPTHGFRPLGAERNECLMHRYYYYVHCQGKRYDLIINTLSREFFLSPATIPCLIEGNVTIIRQLLDSRPPVEALKLKYPFLTWE